MSIFESQAIKAVELIGGVPVPLFKAIITHESGWSPYVTRYEPNYSYLVTPNVFAANNQITCEEETMMQKTSWGLCQIMGANVRALGLLGPLPLALNVYQNLTFGAKFLQRICEKYPILDDQIAAYNAGTPRKNADGVYINQKYVDAVKKIMEATTA